MSDRCLRDIWNTPYISLLHPAAASYLLSCSSSLQSPNGSDLYDSEACYIPSACLMEYEEVTLKRTKGENEKLGLTLCYGTPNDIETDIFISEVENDSIAGRCGLIRVGDQILQINNIDVNTREQAVTLFSENTAEVTLLLARPQLQIDDFMDEVVTGEKEAIITQPTIDEEDEGTTDTGTGENGSTKHEKDSGVGRTDESTKNEESSEHEDLADNELTSPGTTNSANNPELHNTSNESFTSPDMTWAEDGDGEQNGTEYEDKCIGTSSVNMSCEDENNLDSCGGEHDQLTESCSQGNIDRELALLNQEMKNIQIECQSLVQKHVSKPVDKSQSNIETTEEVKDIVKTTKTMERLMDSVEYQQRSTSVRQWGVLLNDECTDGAATQVNNKEKELVHNYVNLPPVISEEGKAPTKSTIDKSQSIAEWVRSTARSIKTNRIIHEENNTSSAYNTGDSCRSTPLTMELNLDKRHQGSLMSLVAPPTEEKGTQFVPEQEYSMYSCESCRQCRQERDRRKEKYSSPEFKTLPARCSRAPDQKFVSVAPSETMYTNEENLEHTIWLQQQMFMQAMEQQRRQRSVVGSESSIKSTDPRYLKKMAVLNKATPTGMRGKHPTGGEMRTTEQNIQMEWRVKKRADGSRYITRRPIRNRMLKQRAQKIMEERTGITTDDDAMSELKVGRYWTKEDRKKQLEQARMHKLKREMMIKAKEQQDGPISHALPPSGRQLIEMNQKKIPRRKGNNFEEFATIQEVLAAQNSRIALAQTKANGGLLSVTTV
ncbi:PDZ domain-containing RING finger protein 4 [Nymphon striatum]|nr:PDZ domain-containing RING finger protein 4 [Nymphon striatum]